MQTQESAEKNARYYIGCGVVFSVDFVEKHIGFENMKALNLTGAYVFRIEKPQPCMFITFGAGGAWIPNLPAYRMCSVSRSDAELHALSQFMLEIDVANTYNIRSSTFHIDFFEGSVVTMRRPSDAEIGKMHIAYRDSKMAALSANMKKRRMLKKKNESQRIERELRALDRRRFSEASIIPPPERMPPNGNLDTLRHGPDRQVTASTFIPGARLDPYRSDTDDERPTSFEKSQMSLIRSRGVLEEPDDVDTGCVYGIAIDDDGASCSSQAQAKCQPVPPTTFEKVMKLMQVPCRQKPPTQ